MLKNRNGAILTKRTPEHQGPAQNRSPRHQDPCFPQNPQIRATRVIQDITGLYIRLAGFMGIGLTRLMGHSSKSQRARRASGVKRVGSHMSSTAETPFCAGHCLKAADRGTEALQVPQ